MFNSETSKVIEYNKISEFKVSFSKKELGIILNLYGKMVAIGEWRDYGISMFKDSCIFSIYKHSAEYPIFMVKKNISKSNKSNIFTAVAMDGRILSRSSKLSSALKPLEVKLIRRVK